MRLNALSRRGKGVQTRVLNVGDLEYNLDTLEVRRQGKLLQLNPTALKILQALMEASPAVVTRQELETRVWGEELPDSDRLRVHIHGLRAVVDKPFDTPADPDPPRHRLPHRRRRKMPEADSASRAGVPGLRRRPRYRRRLRSRIILSFVLLGFGLTALFAFATNWTRNRVENQLVEDVMNRNIDEYARASTTPTPDRNPGIPVQQMYARASCSASGSRQLRLEAAGLVRTARRHPQHERHRRRRQCRSPTSWRCARRRTRGSSWPTT